MLAANSTRKKHEKDSQITASFVTKLCDLITHCHPDIGGWHEDGTGFILRDTERFAAEVIPTAFKHNNLLSFVRQLNSYGFKRTNCGDPAVTGHAFRNQYFHRDRPDLYKLIKRAEVFGKRSYFFQ